MSVVTQDFVAAGKPTYIVANVGVKYTDITDGMVYQQTTMPYGKNWKVISNRNVFIPPSSGVTSVNTSTPLQSSGGATPNISIPKADATTDGYLSSADWNTFNSGGGVTPSALTKTDDTNVTLALTGTPNSALLQAVNIAVGWSGTLADSRISSASVWNAKQNALAGSGLVKSTAGTISYVSGTSSQFVKGDGSLDSNTYLTSAVTSVGATGPITSSGGTTPTISTSMNTGKLIGRNTAGTGVMEEISVGTGLTLSGGTLSTATTLPIYLVAHDENTQTAAVRNTGYPMSIDWTDESNGITINAHTQITFYEDGVYNIQFSAQFSNNDNQLHDVDVWFQKNNAPIPWSNSRFTINASHGGDPGHHIAAWNFMSTFSAGDFVEIYWETDDVLVVIERIAAANDAPDTPSIILTVDKL